MPVSHKEYLEMADEAVAKAEKLFGVNLYEQGWKFSVNNRKRALGLCSYNDKTIYLSKHFMQVNTPDQVMNTTLHEVSHALVGHKEGHGPIWQQCFKMLGGNGKRCADPSAGDTNTVPYKYHLIDTRNNKMVQGYHRKPRRNFDQCALKNDPDSLGKLKLVKV